MANQVQTYIGYKSSAMAHTSPTFYSVTSPRSPRVHLQVTYFQFDGSLSFGYRAFCICTKNMEFLTSSHSAVSNTLLIDVIWRPTTFSQPILPPAHIPKAPWFSSEILVLYKSLTYSLNCYIFMPPSRLNTIITVTVRSQDRGLPRGGSIGGGAQGARAPPTRNNVVILSSVSQPR